MPFTSLLAAASPMMVAVLPEPAGIEHGVAGSTVTITDTAIGAAPILLDLSWSLAKQQVEGDVPPEASGPANTGTGDEQTGDDEFDPESENVIVVQGTVGPPVNDPMEALNEESFRITQDIDQRFVEPVAGVYRDGLPGPLRDGLGNFIRNLGEPVNFVNFLLQLKIGKAFETLGRFGINSTLGLGGVFDIAGEPGVGLPYRRNGFANTLGFYGVGTGPYLFLPLTGSTSVRDLIGNSLDGLILPTIYKGTPLAEPEVVIPIIVVSSLQSRLEIDEQLERINASDDPYGTIREGYLTEREAAIQEFRDGSPLQGIPDRERPDGEKLQPLANTPAPEAEETDALDDEAGDNAPDQSARPADQRKVVLVQTREMNPDL